MDPDPDPGGPKTYGSDRSGFGNSTLSLPNTRGEGAGCGPGRGAARPRGGGDRRGAALRADRQRPPLLVVQAAGRAASGKIESEQRQLGGPLGG
jgi:hypothetical protein